MADAREEGAFRRAVSWHLEVGGLANSNGVVGRSGSFGGNGFLTVIKSIDATAVHKGGSGAYQQEDPGGAFWLSSTEGAWWFLAP